MTLPKEKERSDESEKCIFSYVDICKCLLNKIDVPSPALAVFKVTSAGLGFLCSRVGDKADAAEALLLLGSNLCLTPRILTENFLNFLLYYRREDGITSKEPTQTVRYNPISTFISYPLIAKVGLKFVITFMSIL